MQREKLACRSFTSSQVTCAKTSYYSNSQHAFIRVQCLWNTEALGFVSLCVNLPVQPSHSELKISSSDVDADSIINDHQTLWDRLFHIVSVVFSCSSSSPQASHEILSPEIYPHTPASSSARARTNALRWISSVFSGWKIMWRLAAGLCS